VEAISGPQAPRSAYAEAGFLLAGVTGNVETEAAGAFLVDFGFFGSRLLLF
jgi:hypothetical protein